jgi:hypothetical protein
MWPCRRTAALETAIKAAGKWAYKVKGVPHDRAEIIAAEDNFHGRTITIVAFSSQRVIFYVADVDALYDRALVSGYQPATVPLIDPDGHGPAIPRGVGRAYSTPIIR